MIQPEVTIQISKTADGKNDYLQVMSADMVAINIVLVAQKIKIDDDRPADKIRRRR